MTSHEEGRQPPLPSPSSPTSEHSDKVLYGAGGGVEETGGEIKKKGNEKARDVSKVQDDNEALEEALAQADHERYSP